MRSRISRTGVLLLSLLLLTASPALALKKLSNAISVNEALRYGMVKQGSGYLGLLGSNWREGSDGTLLNVYTPFMMLAAKVANSAYPTEPTSEDLKKARKKNAGLVAKLTDPKRPPWIKYSVSFYGEHEGFAKDIHARLEGFGRGKQYTVKPDKVQYDQIADAVGTPGEANAYEAVNAYYFDFDDVEPLEDYRLILESTATGRTWEFKIHNDEIY